MLGISASPGETNLLLCARMHREFFAYNCRQPPTLHTGQRAPTAAGTFLVRPIPGTYGHAASLDPDSAPARCGIPPGRSQSRINSNQDNGGGGLR
jgi:hypothetical protein